MLQTTLGKLVVIALAAFFLSRSWRKERVEGDKELDQIKDEIRRLKSLEEEALAKQASSEPHNDQPE
jgi:uncharacterized protein YPO0396